MLCPTVAETHNQTFHVSFSCRKLYSLVCERVTLHPAIRNGKRGFGCQKTTAITVLPDDVSGFLCNYVYIRFQLVVTVIVIYAMGAYIRTTNNGREHPLRQSLLKQQ